MTDLAELPETFDVLALAETRPWLPIALKTSGTAEERHLLQAWRKQKAMRHVIALQGPGHLIATELRGQLTGHDKAAPDEVANYIAGRCGCPKFATALRASLLREASPPLSTRHGIFRRLGPLTLKDWVALYRLAQVLALPRERNLLDIAMDLDLDGRTVNSYRKRLLDLSWEEIRNRFGWRWMVEQVLRQNGYIEGAPSSGDHPLEPGRSFARRPDGEPAQPPMR